MIIQGKRARCKTKSYYNGGGFSGILKGRILRVHLKSALEEGPVLAPHVMADVAQTRQAERGLSEAARVLEVNRKHARCRRRRHARQTFRRIIRLYKI